MTAELRGDIERLEEKLEEMAVKQEQSDAKFYSHITDLGQAESTLYGHITALEVKMEEIDSGRKELEAILHGHITALEEELKKQRPCE